jgi:hypothetical protein
MDELAFHPYPQPQQGPPSVRYGWPTAGLSNLDRIKQAVWDAFNGTAQQTFAEPGNRVANPLRFDLDEVGWQVAPLPALASMYTGVETPGTKLISEDDQAAYYRDTVTLAECDPSVRMLSFFHLLDETDLARWQSGIERADGSHRPSYDAVKQVIAQDARRLPDDTGQLAARHRRRAPGGGVGEPQAPAGEAHALELPRGRRARRPTSAPGLFKAGPSKVVLGKRLAAGRPKPLLSARGVIKAQGRLVYFPRRRLRPGRYVYAIRMSATMNSKRASVLVSRPSTSAPARSERSSRRPPGRARRQLLARPATGQGAPHRRAAGVRSACDRDLPRRACGRRAPVRRPPARAAAGAAARRGRTTSSSSTSLRSRRPSSSLSTRS